MNKPIPRSKLEHLIWKPGDDTQPRPETVPAIPQPETASIVRGRYDLMDETNTYALGVEALRDSYGRGECPAQSLYTKDDGGQIVRPLTFKEVLQARVDDFNRVQDNDGNERDLDDRLRLFDHWIDSATGVAYKAGSTKFKIIPACRPLVEIDAGFNEGFMNVDYGALAGIELDSGAAKYNELLTREAVMGHEGWLAAVEGNRELLQEYSNIVFEQLERKYSRNTGMRFWVLSNTGEDQLRALYVYNLNYISNAYGINSLNSNGSFLRVAHTVAPEGRRTKK
jgi:hypothetical protein